MRQPFEEKFNYYNNPNNDKVTKLKDTLDQAKETLTQNLDSLIGRGEKLDVLKAKTEVSTNLSYNIK